jgi:hypothetical protein
MVLIYVKWQRERINVVLARTSDNNFEPVQLRRRDSTINDATLHRATVNAPTVASAVMT